MTKSFLGVSGLPRLFNAALDRRRLLQVSGVAVLAPALGLHGSHQTAAADGKLTFWKAPHGDREQQYWEPIIADFEAAHEGVTIEHTITPWQAWEEKYTTAFASGAPPDVLYMVDWFAPKYIEAGQLVDFDATGYLDQVRDQYDPSVLDKAAYRGKHYGVTFASDPQFLFYNKDMFAEAGIAGPPADWAAFMETAKALTKDGVYGYTAPTSLKAYGFMWFLSWLWGAGGDVINAEGTASTLNTPEAEEALTFYVDLHEAEVITPFGQYDETSHQDLFMQQGAAMTITAASMVGRILADYPDLNFGVAMPPAGPKALVAFADWGYFAIAEASQQKDLAFEWVKFITSREQATRYLENVRLFPARTDVTFLQDDPAWPVYVENLPRLRNFPLHPKILEIMRVWWTEAEAALLGRQSPKEALVKADAAVNAVINE